MGVRWVALGDSLTQGIQSFGAAESSRPYGYMYLLARLAGLGEEEFVPPRIADPGWPCQMELVLRRPWECLRRWARQGFRPVRSNPQEQPHNLAVGALTLRELLTLTVSNRRRVALTSFARRMVPLVYAPSQGETAVEMALRLQPEVVFCWIGNNDTLIALLSNWPEALTPEEDFRQDYLRLVEMLLEGTSARLVLATLPSFLPTPFWAELRRARFLNEPPRAEEFLQRLPSTPVQGSWLERLERALEERLRRLNAFLRSLEGERVLVVDVAKAHERIAVEGWPVSTETLPFRLAGGRLTLAYPRRRGEEREGGLMSLDGLHPSRTGHALLAYWFAENLREKGHWPLPLPDVLAVAARDPLLLHPPPLAPFLFRWGMRLYVRGVERS